MRWSRIVLLSSYAFRFIARVWTEARAIKKHRALMWTEVAMTIVAIPIRIFACNAMR